MRFGHDVADYWNKVVQPEMGKIFRKSKGRSGGTRENLTSLSIVGR